MSSRKTVSILALASMASVLGLAAMPAAAENALTIQTSQSNTAVLKAEIEEVRARAELATAKAELRKLESAEDGRLGNTASGNAGGASVGIAGSGAAAIAPETPPQVVAIYGTGRDLVASLRYESGLRLDARGGDNIDGGYRVSSVSPSQVTITKDGKSHTLRIYTGASTVRTNATSGALSSPGVMPMIMR